MSTAIVTGSAGLIGSETVKTLCRLGVRVLGIDNERFWALSTDPASLTAVEMWPDGRMSIPFVNRTSHLT